MKRRIAYIISLLLMVQLAAAQTVSRYEYWVDNDYAGRHTGSGTKAEETINFQLDVNGRTEGVHSLLPGLTETIQENILRRTFDAPAEPDADPEVYL